MTYCHAGVLGSISGGNKHFPLGIPAEVCDSKRLNDCKRQGADQPSTRAGWPVPLLFTTVSVENYGFSNIL